MDPNKVIASLLSNDVERKNQAISTLQTSLRDNSGLLLIGNMKRLFAALKTVLEDSQPDLVISCTHFLTEFMQNYDPEFEIQFASICPSIVANLGHSRVCSLF